MRKLGVLDLDAFYPPKDRAALALKLNGLLASPVVRRPGTRAVPLDIERHAPRRRPAAGGHHLGLPPVRGGAHVRGHPHPLQDGHAGRAASPGTGELRALIYMDEVFGYVPPTAMPPAKKPILTILKQARAHGVGMVLSTQNPVDLDYKAISNAGTWMIGRLQTERDKARLLDGLTSAAGRRRPRRPSTPPSPRSTSAQFLFHSTRADAPVRFSTRWAMSYLAGPLTRDQIKLPHRRRELAARPVPGEPAPADSPPSRRSPALAEDETLVAPEVAAGVERLLPRCGHALGGRGRCRARAARA